MSDPNFFCSWRYIPETTWMKIDFFLELQVNLYIGGGDQNYYWKITNLKKGFSTFNWIMTYQSPEKALPEVGMYRGYHFGSQNNLKITCSMWWRWHWHWGWCCHWYWHCASLLTNLPWWLQFYCCVARVAVFCLSQKLLTLHVNARCFGVATITPKRLWSQVAPCAVTPLRSIGVHQCQFQSCSWDLLPLHGEDVHSLHCLLNGRACPCIWNVWWSLVGDLCDTRWHPEALLLCIMASRSYVVTLLDLLQSEGLYLKMLVWVLNLT